MSKDIKCMFCKRKLGYITKDGNFVSNYNGHKVRLYTNHLDIFCKCGFINEIRYYKGNIIYNGKIYGGKEDDKK